jgi:transcription elongation factor GreA
VTQTSENVTWLTQEAYNKLKAELEYLTGPARAEISAKIAAAREEGDLRENGGYHAAKEEQGKQELRVRQLTQLLENAKVGEAPAADGAVAPGMVVTIAFDGDEDDTLTFLLASREYASADIETYSPQSPLGTGVIGHKVGEDAQYELPNGKKATVKILKAEPYEGMTPPPVPSRYRGRCHAVAERYLRTASVLKTTRIRIE